MCLNTKLHFALICELLQVKFCKRNPGFMDSVRLGAVRAIDECQYQFRQRRWNCSSLQDNVNSHIDNIKALLGGKMSFHETDFRTDSYLLLNFEYLLIEYLV